MRAFKLRDCPALAEFAGKEDRPASPGCAVFLSRRGQVIDSWVTGYADLEQGTRISEDTRFHVASLSKPFTAFCVLLLAERGELALHERLARFIPELPPAASAIELRHLLNHTSGLRDQWPLLELAGWRSDDTVTADDALRIVLQQRRLNHAPGRCFRYSNSAYTLLARVIEVTTGTSFRRFAEGEIFGPLGMQNTQFLDRPGELIPNRARAYRCAETGTEGTGQWENFSPNLFVPGPTSLWTTIADLSKWDENFSRGTVGSRALFDRMRAASGPATPAGYGFFVQSGAEERLAFHPGNDFGFHAYYGQYLDHDVSVAIMNNANRPGLRGIADGIVAHFEAGSPGRQRFGRRAEAQTVTESVAKQYVGVYESELGEVRRISYDGEVRMWWGGLFTLLPKGHDEFVPSTGGDRIRFLRSGDGSVAGLCLRSMAYDSFWKRSPDVRGDLGLEDLVGEYDLPELKCRMSIERHGDDHVVVFPKYQTSILHSRHGDIFFSDSVWLRASRAHGGVELTVSTPRALNISCTRV